LYLFGKKYRKQEILKKIGDISQLGGIRQYQYTDGVSKGIRAVDIKSPCGIDMTVLLDRGMDIANLFYKNTPLAWRSATRETSPVYYESKGVEWLRTFNGGLLTTCGISYMGLPCEDNGEELGLHGRISNISAERILADGKWEGDSYKMWVQGKVREAKVFGEKLELSRKIITWMDRPTIVIEDTVENIGWESYPHMISYHINFGFPLVDSTSKIVESEAEVVPFDEKSKKGIDSYKSFSGPVHGFQEQIFFHDIKEDSEGNCNIGIVNPEFNDSQGIGVWVKHKKETLPNLVHWKMMGEGEYVCGFEPANTSIRGRKVEREKKNLKYLEPGEKVDYRIEIRVLDSKEDFNGLDEISKL